MIPFGKNVLGVPKMCARCCRVTYTGQGIITQVNANGGVITAERSIPFRAEELSAGFSAYVGAEVTYEVRFRDDNSFEAADIRPAAKGGN